MVTAAVANASREVRQELGDRLATMASDHSRQLARTSKQFLHELHAAMGEDSDMSAELSESSDEEYAAAAPQSSAAAAVGSEHQHSTP